jgi:hypothetical protein
MNIFSVLGVRYEIFHSRMLHWLWDPKGDHGAGDRFWQPFWAQVGLQLIADLTIDDEVKIDATVSGRWRLADLLIRAGDLLILIENKVDPAYQDVLQVQDEIAGGKALADAEGRRFLFVLIAPGPLTADMKTLVTANGGVFVSWTELLDRLTAVPRDALDAHVSEIIRQYLEFARRPAVKAAATADDKLVRETEQALRTVVTATAIGATVTAVDLWAEFLKRFPDHAAALDAFYADSKHYSAKAWFAFKLQQLAAKRDLIEDTSTWQTTSASAWGFPKVRVYRRIGA